LGEIQNARKKLNLGEPKEVTLGKG